MWKKSLIMIFDAITGYGYIYIDTFVFMGSKSSFIHIKLNLKCFWTLIYFLEVLSTFLYRFLCTLDSNLNTTREYQKVTALIIFVIYIYISEIFQSTTINHRQAVCTIFSRINFKKFLIFSVFFYNFENACWLSRTVNIFLSVSGMQDTKTN